MLREAVVWLCRSPQRLAASVVVVLCAALLLGGAFASGRPTPPTEDARAPVPSSAQLPDAAPFVTSAVTFVRAWAQLGAQTPQQWQAALTPLVTPQLAAALAGTDPTALPGVPPEGEPVVRFLATSSALIAVPLTDGSSVLVTVVDGVGGARVSDVQPHVGD